MAETQPVQSPPEPGRNLSLTHLSVLTVCVALIATACAAGVHTACFHPPPPVARPDPGTPRGEYCAVLVPWHPWVSLTVGPCLLVILPWVLLAPRRRVGVVILAALLCAALIANALIVNNLTSAATI